MDASLDSFWLDFSKYINSYSPLANGDEFKKLILESYIGQAILLKSSFEGNNDRFTDLNMIRELKFHLMMATAYIMVQHVRDAKLALESAKSCMSRIVSRNFAPIATTKSANCIIDAAMVIAMFCDKQTIENVGPEMTTLAKRAFMTCSSQPMSLAAIAISAIMASESTNVFDYQGKMKFLEDAEEKLNTLLTNAMYSDVDVGFCPLPIAWLRASFGMLNSKIVEQKNRINLVRKRLAAPKPGEFEKVLMLSNLSPSKKEDPIPARVLARSSTEFVHKTPKKATKSTKSPESSKKRQRDQNENNNSNNSNSNNTDHSNKSRKVDSSKTAANFQSNQAYNSLNFLTDYILELESKNDQLSEIEKLRADLTESKIVIQELQNQIANAKSKVERVKQSLEEAFNSKD